LDGVDAGIGILAGLDRRLALQSLVRLDERPARAADLPRLSRARSSSLWSVELAAAHRSFDPHPKTAGHRRTAAPAGWLRSASLAQVGRCIHAGGAPGDRCDQIG